MLTTTINNDRIYPTYACGTSDTSVDLKHGARFAEHKLVKNADKHADKCKVCQVHNVNPNITDLLKEVFS